MATEKQFLTRLQEIKQRDVEVLLKKAYRGIWETAIKKYSDSAHFVYVLLRTQMIQKPLGLIFALKKTDFGLSTMALFASPYQTRTMKMKIQKRATLAI
jgi:hypothetical protein